MSCYQKFYTNQIHSSSLLCQLATMWKSQILCDAIIRTGPVVTKAHRVVLVAACPMLQSMENASMGSHLEVRLASDIKQDSINTFLQYLYEGFMMLTEENCKDVEKIARLLQVDSVTKCCMDFYKCLTVKTGQSHPGDQYKYTSYDMLEFRHVRSSDIQKTVHDRVMKRGSDFTRPSSPSHKRQKIHKPSSPSFEILSTSHRADDTLSMAHSYGGAAPDPWERVPRLGAGGRHNVSSQPGVIDIVEDSIEIIQTEQPEKDARGNVRSDSRMKQKSVSIAVSSQMNSVADVQIVNVSDKNDTSSTKQNSANSNNTAPTTTTVSSSGRGSITVSPLAIFNNDTSNQTTMSRDSSHFPKSQPQSSPEVQDAHFVHRSSDPSATSTPSQPVFPTSMSPISRPPAISQAKPYAAGSAQQAAMSPGESNSTAKGPRLQTSRIEQEKNTLSPASFEKGQENSSKVDSETPSISADKAPDISIVKIEQEEDNTGGLDMYVDIPEDGMMRIRRGMDDTEDGSDLEHDMMREEASNEGSNVSGDQNNSWYIGQFKEPSTTPKRRDNAHGSQSVRRRRKSKPVPIAVQKIFDRVQGSHFMSFPISDSHQGQGPLEPGIEDISKAQELHQHKITGADSMEPHLPYMFSPGGTGEYSPGKLQKVEHRIVHTEGSKYKPCVFCQINKVKTKSGWYVYTYYKCETCDVPLCKGRGCFYQYHQTIVPANVTQ